MRIFYITLFSLCSLLEANDAKIFNILEKSINNGNIKSYEDCFHETLKQWDNQTGIIKRKIFYWWTKHENLSCKFIVNAKTKQVLEEYFINKVLVATWKRDYQIKNDKIHKLDFVDEKYSEYSKSPTLAIMKILDFPCNIKDKVSFYSNNFYMTGTTRNEKIRKVFGTNNLNSFLLTSSDLSSLSEKFQITLGTNNIKGHTNFTFSVLPAINMSLVKEIKFNDGKNFQGEFKVEAKNGFSAKFYFSGIKNSYGYKLERIGLSRKKPTLENSYLITTEQKAAPFKVILGEILLSEEGNPLSINLLLKLLKSKQEISLQLEEGYDPNLLLAIILKVQKTKHSIVLNNPVKD